MNAVVIIETEILSDGSTIRVARAKPRIACIEAGRAMNHMDPDTKAVHLRLCEWSSWVKRALECMGYPTQSYYSKWAALGIAPQPGFDAALPDRPNNVDKAVARLGEIDRSVIWRYYCQFRDAQIWRGLHGVESQTSFDRVLRRSRMRISGFLLAIDHGV